MNPLATHALRAATAGDTEAIVEVLFGSREAFLPYAPLVPTRAETAWWVANVLLSQGPVTVAEVDGRVVGIVATHNEGAVTWVLRSWSTLSGESRARFDCILFRPMTGPGASTKPAVSSRRRSAREKTMKSTAPMCCTNGLRRAR